MTGAPRRYMRVGLAAAGVVSAAIAAGALIEYLGSAFLSGRPSTGTAGPVLVSATSAESGAVMSLHEAPRPLPEIRFRDGDGRELGLGAFRGKVVLLNIWATWCGPCRREMPTLDRLQAALGGSDFEVVALSIDRAGIEAVEKFYAEVGVAHLARYIDESGRAAPQLNALGLPTTLLIDRNGREIARHVGPAEWDAPEMLSFLRQQVSPNSGALRPGTSNNQADRSGASTARMRIPRSSGTDLPMTGGAAPATLKGTSP